MYRWVGRGLDLSDPSTEVLIAVTTIRLPRATSLRRQLSLGRLTGRALSLHSLSRQHGQLTRRALSLSCLRSTFRVTLRRVD